MQCSAHAGDRSDRIHSHFETLERRQLLASAADPVVSEIIAAESYSPPSVYLYKTNSYLTRPAAGAPLDIARDYLRSNAGYFGLATSDIDNAVLRDQYTDSDSGMTHITMRQTVNGLQVANGDLNVNVARDGRILSVGVGFVPNVPAQVGSNLAPSVSVLDALRSAAGNNSLKLTSAPVITSESFGSAQVTTLSAPSISVDAIPATLQYVPTQDGVKLAWRFVLNVPGSLHWYDTNVDASNGKKLWTTDWVDSFAADGAIEAAYNKWVAAGKPLIDNVLMPKPTQSGPTGGPEVPTYTAAYNVYPRPLLSPSSGGRSVQNDPWDLAASPRGWQDTDGDDGAESDLSAGNNVSAQTDTNANNTIGAPDIQADGGTLNPDGSGSLNFDFPINLANAPSTYQSAAVTNLYYWNNVLHDLHYKYGFTEAARNFQQNTYGLGGIGNDRVEADAQDGSGTNNANFGTPADGSSGRMQMFLFTAPTPDIDGDLDAQVIVHEYGHGVSNRLTNNGSGLGATQSAGMGEGWGDWWGLMLLQTDGSVAAQNAAYPVGTYVLNQPLNGPGIRRQPYSFDMSINNQTLGAYNSSSQVHNAGELWVGALWDMNWFLIEKHGFNPNVAAGYTPGAAGNLLALKLVMDGLKLHPSNPSFLQARDAILSADTALTGGANQKEIWKAFRRRGFGLSASTSSSSSTSVTEAFDGPAQFFEPFVASSTPSGNRLFTASNSISFVFNEAMNPASFSIASDINSFTGPGGVDLLGQITGSAWSNSDKTLTVNFNTQSVNGAYAMSIGPNINAADTGVAMDQDIDGNVAEPSDTYTASFNYVAVVGPEAFGYTARAGTFEALDLVPGGPGVSSILDGQDDANTSVSLGANTFSCYGTTYSTIFVNTNGLVTLGSGSSSFSNGSMGSSSTNNPTQPTIAAMWDDWLTNTSSGTTGDIVLTRLDGANNRMIIEWQNVPKVSNTGGNGTTFQMILQLNTGTNPGNIIFNYVDLDIGGVIGQAVNSSTIGIKDTGRPPARFLDVTVNAPQQSIVSNFAILVSAANPQSFSGTAGDDTFYLRMDATNTNVQVWVNSPIANPPTFTALKSSVSSISFAGITGDDSLTIDHQNGNPVTTGGVSWDGGANTGVGDSLNVIGSAGADAATFTASAVTFGGTTTTAGNENVSFDGKLGNDTLVVSGGPNVLMPASQAFASLTVDTGASASLASNGSRIIRTNALAVNGTGNLDLTDNDLLLDYIGATQLGAVQALINAARTGGNWSGTGLDSSAAANNANANTTLAAIEGSEYLDVYGGGTLFDGLTVDLTSVLVKYTYYGDADFSGAVDFDDYVRADNGFNNGLTGWVNGDADGNGFIDFDDYVLLDNSFNTQGAAL